MSVDFHSLDLPDQGAMLHGLLNQGFPESKDSGLFSPEMLDWKFAKSGGHLNSLIGYVENSPVSFYGVLPRQYSFQGVVKTVGLVVDVLSIPAMRGRGLFVSSGQAVMNKLEKTEIEKNEQIVYEELFYNYMLYGILLLIASELLRKLALRDVV